MLMARVSTRVWNAGCKLEGTPPDKKRARSRRDHRCGTIPGPLLPPSGSGKESLERISSMPTHAKHPLLTLHLKRQCRN